MMMRRREGGREKRFLRAMDYDDEEEGEEGGREKRFKVIKSKYVFNLIAQTLS